MDNHDETMPPQTDDRTPLRVIEDEGTKAAHDLAHTIVRETVNNKGRVDLARLDRVGPTVRTEVLKMLAMTASAQSAPATGPEQTRPAGTTDPQKKRAVAPVKKRCVSTTPAAVPSTRRATKEWRDRCCDTPSSRTIAYRHGLGRLHGDRAGLHGPPSLLEPLTSAKGNPHDVQEPQHRL